MLLPLSERLDRRRLEWESWEWSSSQRTELVCDSQVVISRPQRVGISPGQYEAHLRAEMASQSIMGKEMSLVRKLPWRV